MPLPALIGSVAISFPLSAGVAAFGRESFES